MATTLVHSAQGRGTVLHPRACQHRVEVSGSAAALQPTPALLQSEGLWGCCAALKLQCMHGSSCGPCLAVVLALHRHRSQARPITNRGATGVLQLLHSGGSSCTAAATAGVMPHRWYRSCTAAHPRPVTNRGAGGGGGGLGWVRGGGHFSAGRRVLFSTPVHYGSRWRE